MNTELFSEFLAGSDTIRVYRGDKLLFVSSKAGISSLLDYIREFSASEGGVTVFDRVVGNAAALLLKLILCGEVYSPLGSEIAVETLRRFGIDLYFTEVVPYIQNRSRNGMCPLERLSLSKGPEEFYQACLSSALGHSF